MSTSTTLRTIRIKTATFKEVTEATTNSWFHKFLMKVFGIRPTMLFNYTVEITPHETGVAHPSDVLRDSSGNYWYVVFISNSGNITVRNEEPLAIETLHGEMTAVYSYFIH